MDFLFSEFFGIQIWQFIMLFGAGFASGFIDAICGGGGMITLPAIMAVGAPPHVALATNKLQAVFGSSTASFIFYKKGYFRIKDIITGIVFTFFGAIGGTSAVLFLDSDFLKLLIPFLLVGIIIYTIFSPNLGENARPAKMPKNAFYVIFGFLLGFYDGFFGPGTGSLWTFALVGVLGLAMKFAVAQTKAFNFVSNIVSLTVFIIGGEIWWFVGLFMAISQMIGGYFGSFFVIKRDVKYIRAIFLVMVAITTIKLIYDFFK